MIISIVTPILNAAAFLPECIESVQSQGGSGFSVEHIFVDSGSTDGSPEIARSYGCRVEVVPSWGLFRKINEGIRLSVGQVVGVLGGDDTLLPGSLQRVADWYTSRTSEWVAGGIRWTDHDGRSMGDLKPPPRWMTVAAYASLDWSCIPHQSTFMTREFFDQLGGYTTSYSYTGDFQLFARALQVAGFDRIPHSLATYRRHGSNLSMSSSAERLEEHQRTVALFAPASPMLRFVNRLGLRVWLNLASPRWFLLKKLPVLQPLLSPPTPW